MKRHAHANANAKRSSTLNEANQEDGDFVELDAIIIIIIIGAYSLSSGTGQVLLAQHFGNCANGGSPQDLSRVNARSRCQSACRLTST